MPRQRCLVWATLFAAVLFIQGNAGGYPPQNPPVADAESGPPIPAAQLDDLVAPVALYPDPLVAEVLAAATYPMELVEAEQWVRDHPHWKPSKLMNKAKHQKWDPSVQGLVAFPAVLSLLSQDIQWTTQLGNAFLGQQADVMQAVQRMRAQAEAKGMLHSTPQQTVTTNSEGGQNEIVIEPASPDVWYVPNYNPAYVWGPPVWGAYPGLPYPGIDMGWSWYPGIDVGMYFGGWGGWGWGGWGWTPNWYGGGLYVDNSFFHRYGFRNYQGGMLGRSGWMHNPEHRLGVPYPNREMASRFGRNATMGRGYARMGGNPGMNRGQWAGRQGFGTSGFEQRGWNGNHSVFGGYHSGGMARMQSDRGFSSLGAGRTFGGFGGGMRAGGFGGGGMRGGGFGGGGMRGGAMRGGGRR